MRSDVHVSQTEESECARDGRCSCVVVVLGTEFGESVALDLEYGSETAHC